VRGQNGVPYSRPEESLVAAASDKEMREGPRASIEAKRKRRKDLEYSIVSIRKLRMRNYWFLIRKAGIFCPGKEIKGLRGGVHGYVAQASPQIDTARAGKRPFRTETRQGVLISEGFHA